MKNQIVVLIENPSFDDSARVLGRFKSEQKALGYILKYAKKHGDSTQDFTEFYWNSPAPDAELLNVPMENGKSTAFHGDETRNFLIKDNKLCPISIGRLQKEDTKTFMGGAYDGTNWMNV